MAEGFCSRVAVDNDNSSELSSVLDSASEISEYDSVSESSLLPRLEVEPYLFEHERSSIDREVEDLAEPDSHDTAAGRVGNNNWYVSKMMYEACLKYLASIGVHVAIAYP